MSTAKGTGTLAPGSLRADIAKLTELFEDANRRLKRAETLADMEEAAEERFKAKEQLHVAGEWLADFALLLLRYALHHRREALLVYLREALRPELAELAATVAKLEGRRR